MRIVRSIVMAITSSLVQVRFQRDEIREAQAGVLDAALGDVAQGVMASRQYQPEVWGVDRSLPIHDREACDVSADEAIVIARSSENAPAPRIMRNVVMP